MYLYLKSICFRCGIVSVAIFDVLCIYTVDLGFFLQEIEKKLKNLFYAADKGDPYERSKYLPRCDSEAP